jgi:hypothetical protein
LERGRGLVVAVQWWVSSESTKSSDDSPDRNLVTRIPVNPWQRVRVCPGTAIRNPYPYPNIPVTGLSRCYPYPCHTLMGCHCIVSMHVYIILIRNISCRSSRERVARVISQWFWCKYPAHIFLLHSEGSEKKHRPAILKWNRGTYPLLVPGAVCLCFGGRKGSMTKCVEIQAPPETYWHVFVSPLHAKGHAQWDWGTTPTIPTCTLIFEHIFTDPAHEYHFISYPIL